MLTPVESISLAGDRAKQNDDACGFTDVCGWVIDGATDLHGEPLTDTASDASWIAHFANARLHRAAHGRLSEAVRETSGAAAARFHALLQGRGYEPWQSPIASMLLIQERNGGVEGLDLGDCRMFALDADGASYAVGGHDNAADDETALAATQTDAHKPLLDRTQTIDMLRRMRAAMNRDGARWTFGIDPACAEHARAWTLTLTRPAHLLLMTDGFAALSDRYGAYDVGGLVRAALTRGLQELGRELRAIESAEGSDTRHPRFKKSDDATALLLRLS